MRALEEYNEHARRDMRQLSEESQRLDETGEALHPAGLAQVGGVQEGMHGEFEDQFEDEGEQWVPEWTISFGEIVPEPNERKPGEGEGVPELIRATTEAGHSEPELSSLNIASPATPADDADMGGMQWNKPAASVNLNKDPRLRR
jgi:hypothetical protein